MYRDSVASNVCNSPSIARVIEWTTVAECTEQLREMELAYYRARQRAGYIGNGVRLLSGDAQELVAGLLQAGRAGVWIHGGELHAEVQ